MKGLNLMDKTMVVKGARIAFSIWDVAGKISCLRNIILICMA